MSGLRSIELQVALPHSQTAGKIQDQMQQRGTVAQDHLAQIGRKEARDHQKKVTDNEKTEQKRLANDQEKSKSFARKNNKQHDSEDSNEKHDHPYKGKHVDLSL